MVLYFTTEDGITYSVYVSLDWLEDYITKEDLGDVGEFLDSYTSQDVEKILIALDEDNEPYTIQEEHFFSGFMD